MQPGAAARSLLKLLPSPPWSKSLLDYESRDVRLFVGGVLNFNMGFVNAAVWVSSGSAATHVTGLMTQCAVALADKAHNTDDNSTRMTIQLFCYVFGSFFASLCNGSNKRGVGYSGILAVIAMLLFAASFQQGEIEFSASSSNVRCIFLAAVSAGMQNSMTSTFNGGIRTSHTTGTATDIGIELANLVTGRTPRDELQQLNLLICCGCTFFAGAWLGAVSAAISGRSALCAPSALCALLSTAMLLDHPQQKKKTVVVI